MGIIRSLPDVSPARRRFLKSAAGGLLAAGSLGAFQVRSALARAPLPGPLTSLSGDWKLTFEDDFKDPVRFLKTWELLKRGAHEHRTMRYPKNVLVEDGELDLRLGHQNDPDRPFTGGYVRTRTFRQTYGYFECEMRIADEAGVNNAFRMVSDPKLQGDTQFELDVAEAKYPNVVQVAARRWKPEKIVLAATYRSKARLAETFHRYAMLWTRQVFRFYIDDREIFQVANGFANTPALLLLSNAVAPFAGKNDGDVAGAATSVRHVRVFQNIAA